MRCTRRSRRRRSGAKRRQSLPRLRHTLGSCGRSAQRLSSGHLGYRCCIDHCCSVAFFLSFSTAVFFFFFFAAFSVVDGADNVFWSRLDLLIFLRDVLLRCRSRRSRRIFVGNHNSPSHSRAAVTPSDSLFDEPMRAAPRLWSALTFVVAGPSVFG